MKILLISSGDFFSTYGGGQVYVKNIVDEFIRQHKDIVVVSTVNGIYQNKWQEKKYKTIPLYEISNLDDEHFAELISQINPDIIHAHSNKSQICRVGKRLNIPVVVTAHHGGILCPAGTRLNCNDEICKIVPNHKDCLKCCLRNIRTGFYWYPFMKLLPEKAYIKFGKWLSSKPFIPFISPIGKSALMMVNKRKEWEQIANLCTLMISPCNELGEAMVRCGLPEEKLKVIPHGIPLPKEVPPFPEIKDGAIHFFYVGRICYFKGVHVLLEAFHNFENSKARLHLIGEASSKQEKRYQTSLKKKYASDSRIIWHGKVSPDKIFETIKDFHVAVTASPLESFGLNIAESLAMGKPVLSIRNGGAEMQIKDGVNGWLVDSNNPESLSFKMEEITYNSKICDFHQYNNFGIDPVSEHCNFLIYTYMLV